MTNITKSISIIFLLCVLIQNTYCQKLQKGEIFLTITQQHQENKNYKVNINSKTKSVLELTQSSRIKIQAKLEFATPSFRPEFFSFRLRHPLYQNLSEPVLAVYNAQQQSYQLQLDLGDPKQIKPFSDKYSLQVILADEKLQKNIRNVIADCNITFRKSWDSIPSSDLHYKNQGIIQTNPPAERVDPPKIFTLFIVIVILAINAVFVYGLNYLKVNVNLFPKSSTGFLMNIGLVVIIMANLTILLKFWISWTFLETLQYLFILIVPTALIANYALVYVKKH